MKDSSYNAELRKWISSRIEDYNPGLASCEIYRVYESVMQIVRMRAFVEMGFAKPSNRLLTADEYSFLKRFAEETLFFMGMQETGTDSESVKYRAVTGYIAGLGTDSLMQCSADVHEHRYGRGILRSDCQINTICQKFDFRNLEMIEEIIIKEADKRFHTVAELLVKESRTNYCD